MQIRANGLAVLVGASLALGGAAAPSSAADVTVVKIGALVDQTGASTSPLFTRAVELAALQMNQALTDDGARVRFEVVFGDTRSNAALARSLALDLVNNQHVVGVLTAGSGETQGVNRYNYQDVALVANRFPVTCFMCSSGFINDPANADPAFADPDKWLFRVFYNSNYEAAVLSQVIVANGGDTNGDGVLQVGILHDGGHLALAQAISPMLPNFYPGPVSVALTNSGSFASLADAWAAVVAGAPDVVVMAMLPAGAGNGLKAYRAAGYTLPIFSNNSFRRDYILADPTIGSVADGLQGSSVTLVDASASGEAFLRSFEAYTGQKPELTSSGAYDGTMTLMLAALAAAGDSHRPTPVTAAAVRDQLARINEPYGFKVRPRVTDLETAVALLRHGSAVNYEGAYNPDDWNDVGDIFPPLVHWKVENGRFVEYEQYTCDPQHALCPAVQ